MGSVGRENGGTEVAIDELQSFHVAGGREEDGVEIEGRGGGGEIGLVRC